MLTSLFGILSIIVGSVSVVVWQLLEQPYGILSIVFGSFWGVITFFLVTFIENKQGKLSAPSAYLDL